MTTPSATHFLPFLFADPLVFGPKGWLSRGVVLFGLFVMLHLKLTCSWVQKVG